jgi:hypothetical protein
MKELPVKPFRELFVLALAELLVLLEEAVELVAAS